MLSVTKVTASRMGQGATRLNAWVANSGARLYPIAKVHSICVTLTQQCGIMHATNAQATCKPNPKQLYKFVT